uniref:Uncharacterized protein n=1 Tax=Cacopsylla melanoneura TaxID=428564 RepID=A0A8D9AI18_9HEMI
MREELIELIREGMKRVIRLWDNIPDTSSIHDASFSLPQRRTGTYIGHRRTDFHDSNADSSYVRNNNFVSNHRPLPWIRPLESLFFMVCLAIVLYALPPPPTGMSATSPDVLVGILSILFLIIMIPILLTALSKVIKVYVKIVVALFKVMMLIIGLLLLVRIFSH